MKRILIVVTALLFISSSSVLAKKPEGYVRGPMPFGPMPFIDCTQFGEESMDFWLWVTGETMETGKIFFNRDGSWNRTIGHAITTDVTMWAPADPGCSAYPFATCVNPFIPAEGKVLTLDEGYGTPDHQTQIYRDWFLVDPDPTVDGDEYMWPTWGKIAGINFKIVVPGYGAIVHKAGMMTHQMNPDTWEWETIKITPNYDSVNIDDMYAICSFMAEK